MSKEWQSVTLAEISDDISYGYTASASNLPCGPKFLRITDIQGGVVDWENVPYCEINERDFKKNRLKTGDIVIARTGNSTGENYMFDSSEDCVFASYLIRFRISEEKANPYYVWLNLRTKGWLNFIAGSKSGSAQAGANAKVLGQYEIRLPDREAQDVIAKVFLDINNKIALNRQINQTLEAMAQALFKSWFVDFEPVKAKMSALAVGGSADDANLAAMSAISGKTTEQLLTLKTTHPDQYQQLYTTADLFPSEMVDSELGEIPKGWEVGTVGDVAKAKGGYAFKSTDFSDKGCPVIKIKNITGNGTVDIEQDSCVIQSATIKTDRFRLYDGDLVMAMTGATVGKIGLINTYGLDIYINQRVAFFESDRYGKKISWFLFCLFNTQDAFQFVVGAAQGSAQPNISSTGIEMTPTVIPCQNTMESFLNQVDNLFRRWLANNSECVVLSDLRDSLLPKLLAGELVVDGVSDDV